MTGTVTATTTATATDVLVRAGERKWRRYRWIVTCKHSLSFFPVSLWYALLLSFFISLLLV